MTTIRFEETDGRFAEEAGQFLQSLGLAPARWQEEQAVEVKEGMWAKIFEMELPIFARLREAKSWVCRVEEREGSVRLVVSDEVWAARIEDEQNLREKVGAFPETLKALSLSGCQGLIDLGPLSALHHLAHLDVCLCESLEDLGPLSGLTGLTSLNLEGCEALADLVPLAGLTQLENLPLEGCKFLTNLSPLAGLMRLKDLDLGSCESITDVGPLSGLTQLRSLKLGGCEELTDLGPLAGLTKLTSLELLHWKGLTDLRPLSGLTQLTNLLLYGCKALTDVTPLSCLTGLTELMLGDCSSLREISPLSFLSRLRHLDLQSCVALVDLAPLSGLAGLESLILNDCRSLEDLAPLSGLTGLTRLELNSCSSFRKVADLSQLKGVTSLCFFNCESLCELGGLAGMSQLTSLELGNCHGLSDLRAISSLGRLVELSLYNCFSLTDVGPLSGLTQLTSLDLRSCESLKDLLPIAGLLHLQELNLTNCQAVTSIEPLSQLRRLSSLDLSECHGLADLSPLSGLAGLKSLKIQECRRLRSLEPIRVLTLLRQFETDFHPSVVAELRAHIAGAQTDRLSIIRNAEGWLREAAGFQDGSAAEQERFATTLGEAFSLLGEHPIELPYEEYLRANPDFSAAPWKAWLGGTRAQSGFGLLRRRVERRDMAASSVGCVGGVCAVLPDQAGPGEAQAWARDWLARMESAWSGRARELLSVSAELCLAHVRLGLGESLDRWLARFTDPSDPAALDPVHAALGAWQLGRGELEAASRHAMGMERLELRDRLLVRIIKACVGTDGERAGRLLLLVDNAELAGNLAARLAGQSSFVASAVNVERLLVACGGSASALAALVDRLGSGADPTRLAALSGQLQAGPEAARMLTQARLLRLLAATLPEGPWQFDHLLSKDERTRLVAYLSQPDSQ